MKRKTDAAPIERYLSETERDRFRAAFCARTSDAAAESAVARRTRLSPAELYLRPPVIDAVECPAHLMPPSYSPAPSPARPPAIVQHSAAGNVVSLAAFRAAREARTSRPAGGDKW